MTKKTCALLFAALWIGVSAYSQDITASNKAAFNRAIKAINANSADGAYTITVSGNFKINPAFFADNARKTVTIKGDGSIRTISNNKDKNALFTVPKGITLTLDNNITLNGNNKEAPLVFVQGGSLVMRTGSTVSGARGVGVHVGEGSFTMQGGAISGNSGGGVYVEDGSFTMSDGSISGNTASGRGGGVDIRGGSFTMLDGTISENKADSGGGGVSVRGGSFTMGGGAINGNTTNMAGGGVYVTEAWRFNARGDLIRSTRISFTMKGGTVSGNTVFGSSGGGVGVWDNGTFTMSGGTISGNTARYGGGVLVFADGTFIKQSGGVIYGSNASASLKNTAHDGDSYGHAVSSGSKKRNSTAGVGVTLNSGVSGSAGGWE